MVPRPREPRPVPAMDERFQGHGGGRPSTCSLASDIDTKLLRAVPMDVCLQKWGVHFRNDDRDAYHLSQRVEKIDSFLSHDWKTGRWEKTITLLVYFNSVPASVATLVMCSFVCVLIICKALSSWLAGTLCIHGTFWFVLSFWQRIRSKLHWKHMVFLDCLCIAQHDVDTKREGILALGGFLSRSKKLVVLWSPRYFLRLWTAFELSAFLKEDRRRTKDISFAPASMGSLLICFTVFATIMVTCFHLIMTFQYTDVTISDLLLRQEAILALAIMMPSLLVVLPVSLYVGTLQMKALLQLNEQLSNFSVRAAQCSCCEMDHCHPQTGEELLCDRKLVFQTLRRWFPDENSEGHLDKFDHMLRKQLSGFVQEVLGSGAPHLRFVLASTAAPLLGILCHYVYMAATDPFVTAAGWMMGWFQIPPMMFLCFWELLLAWRIGAKYHGRWALWLLFPLFSCACILFNSFLWGQFVVMRYTFGFSFNWPVVGSLAFMWILAAILYIWEYSYVFPSNLLP